MNFKYFTKNVREMPRFTSLTLSYGGARKAKTSVTKTSFHYSHVMYFNRFQRSKFFPIYTKLTLMKV